METQHHLKQLLLAMIFGDREVAFEHSEGLVSSLAENAEIPTDKTIKRVLAEVALETA